MLVGVKENEIPASTLSSKVKPGVCASSSHFHAVILVKRKGIDFLSPTWLTSDFIINSQNCHIIQVSQAHKEKNTPQIFGVKEEKKLQKNYL